LSIKLETRQINGVTVLDASGRITLGEDATAFRTAVHDLLAKGQNKLLLNLAEISYIDSSGIGELISVSTAVANHGGKVKLLNLTKRVLELLQITKTSSLFDIHTDEATALAAFAD
jgi:anti-sigma B factor antagonist